MSVFQGHIEHSLLSRDGLPMVCRRALNHVECSVSHPRRQGLRDEVNTGYNPENELKLAIPTLNRRYGYPHPYPPPKPPKPTFTDVWVEYSLGGGKWGYFGG